MVNDTEAATQPVGGHPKVSTTLAAEDAPKVKAMINVTTDELAIGDAVDSHRSRRKYASTMSLSILFIYTWNRERELQRTNLNKLLNAGSIREYWEIIRSFTDTKPREAQVPHGGAAP
jgi:hypothetical protein